MVTQSKQVRLFLKDGTAGGIITAEIMNWTGHAVAASRSDLKQLIEREESGRTGVYFLLGDDPENAGRTKVYIGEGDVVRTRLKMHALPPEKNGKDFWQRVVILTNKDANLTKAHARYLESRFIDLAKAAGRSTVENSTAPIAVGFLPEADASDMEYFIEQARILLPVLGVNVFRSPTSDTRTQGETHLEEQSATSSNSPVFSLTSPKHGIRATAQEVDGEFTVFAGSTARDSWQSQHHVSYRALREALESDGTIVSDPRKALTVFSRNQVFASPSAAAAVVLGRQANGRIEWRIGETGMTYADWQNRDLASNPNGVTI